LTASPKSRPRELKHLPKPSPSPPQPAEQEIAARIATEMERFVNEPVSSYPDDWSYNWDDSTSLPDQKPHKLVLVLSHHYTPAALMEAGMAALKGSDRAIAELIQAAAWCRPGNNQDNNSLQRLAAKTLIEQNPENYQAASTDHIIHRFVEEEYEGDSSGLNIDGPYFDAFLALAKVGDNGEFTHGMNFHTIGQLVSITGSPIPFDMGPALYKDLHPNYHPSWFGDGNGSDYWGPHHGDEDYDSDEDVVGDEDDFGASYVDSFDGSNLNHSLPLYNHELLFASEQALETHQEEQESLTCMVGYPQQIEFVGNGMPYEGRVYSRAVIVMWPKQHRAAVQKQTKGGAAAAAAAESA